MREPYASKQPLGEEGYCVVGAAKEELLPEHDAQLMNDLRVTKKPVGYLINFGKPGALDWKRFLLSEYLHVD